MKTLSCILSLFVALALAPGAMAEEKKIPAEAGKAAEAKPAKDGTKKPADAKPKVAKPLPFETTVDDLDAAGKTFTHNNQDGKVVKFVITDKTVIKQGAADAKFEDIKKGDAVTGMRVKKNDEGTEYDVVKISTFGAQPEPKKVDGKKGEGKKPEAKKDAAPKADAPAKPDAKK